MALNFASAFAVYKIRTEGVWTTQAPALKVSCKSSADNLSGVYSLEYPNPRGFCNTLFTHFNEQEIWMADLEEKVMHRVFKGQINSIDRSGAKNILKIDGRGLSGLLTDRKVNDSWDEKRLDFILCDPTFGCIPLAFDTTVTTWHGFTDDFDRFDYWSDARWGSIPAYCTVWEDTNELEFAGDAGSTRTIYGTTEYLYEVIEFKAKVSAASNTVRFGFGDDDLSDYCRFELTAAGVNMECANTGVETSSAVSSPPTQTSYHYYRIEWDNAEVRFFIDGENVGEITTNVPVGNLKPFMQVAASAQTLTVDYVKMIVLTREMEAYVAKNKIMSDVVKELCDIGTETDDFTFFIDNDYDFNALISSSVSSGYSFGFNSSIYTALNQKIVEIKLTEEAKDLYNKVRIEGGEKLTTVSSPTWTEQNNGDGKSKAFALGYKAKKPMTLVRVNAVNKTEGTDYTVTYGKEHTIVTFATVPTSGHTIDFRYDYYSPIIATAQNTTSQSTYGVTREYTKEDDTITDQTRAQRLASALLAFYSDPRVVIKVTVALKPQLQIGQTVMIDAPYVDITNTAYEIIELEHKIDKTGRSTTMTLASTGIDTSSEIIREILQQLKELRTKGDTDTTVLEEYPMDETLELTEGMELETRWICDSFIIDHPYDNGKTEYGAVLDDFESVDVPTNWTGADFTESRSSDQARTGTYSMKLVYTGTGAKTTTSAQSFGDVSIYTDQLSGTPTTGAIGLWVYLADAAQISAVKIKLGSSASDYAYYTLALYGSTSGNVQRTGWNYYVAKMESPDSVTGTPDWQNCDYATIEITVASGTTLYVDYLTISMSTAADPNRIANNGAGYRYMTKTETITLTG